MPGTESSGRPFFSPDGQRVGFARDRVLQTVPLAGGRPQPLPTLPGGFRGADWGADDLIVYGFNALGGALMQIPAAGGEPIILFTPDDQRRAGYPQVLPGSDVVLFTLSDRAPDTGELHLLHRDTLAHETLLRDAAAGRVLSTGHLVFVRSGALWAVPFDRAALRIAGTPVPVVEGVYVSPGGQAAYATADDGSLVYRSGTGSIGMRSLVWVDRGGQEEVLTLPAARDYVTLSLSPDGRRVAVVAGRQGGNTDVFISELARGSLARLTTGPGVDTNPLWHPDGLRLAYTSTEGGRTTVYVQAADGTGIPEPLLIDETMNDLVPYDWSPDGETLFLTGVSPETGRDIGTVSLDAPGTWEPFLNTAADEYSPVFSPNGRWLAYTSTASGGPQVYVQRYPERPDATPVSVVGGAYRPRWSEDGRELFYLRASISVASGGPPTAMVGVTVDTTDSDPPALVFGEEVELFTWRYYAESSPMPLYDVDVSPGEQRFLMITRDDNMAEPGRAEFKVVQNWTQELLERVPIP